MFHRTGLACIVFAVAACGGPRPPARTKTVVEPVSEPHLATLDLRGDPAFVAVARDVIAVVIKIDPSVAANAGLFDDATSVASFAPDSVAALIARLDRDLATLRGLPWRSWPVDQQIDCGVLDAGNVRRSGPVGRL